MTVDRNNSAVVAAPADDDRHEIHDSVARRRDARQRSNQRLRCTECGQFISGPGGAGFGNGRSYCDDCAVRLDFERGDGSAR